MQSRPRQARAIAWLLAAGVALAAPAAAQSVDGPLESGFVEQRERFTPDGGAPVDLRFLIAPESAAQTPRLVNATHAALTTLSAWLGPLPDSPLTIAGQGWRPGAVPGIVPGVVSVHLRWLTPARDQWTERELVDGIVRQYWTGGAPTPGRFARALVKYTAMRAIHQQLEGSNFATLRFFGGFVPFALRSVLLSPPVADPRPRVWQFDDPDPITDVEVLRGVRALQTLERYVGWPTMLEALSKMRAAATPGDDAGAFAAALSEARGTEMRFLVAECFRPDAVFDYALAGLRSEPGASGLIETTVTIDRRGSGRFAIDEDAGDRDATMPVLVRFADGTQARDYFDGTAASATLIFSTKTAAISARVDPDVTLLLDVNRDNNAISVRDAPISALGVRLALHWMTWLQNAMLSYMALL